MNTNEIKNQNWKTKIQSRCFELLKSWSRHSDEYWYPMPDNGQLACYGTGYSGWGVQTNQKFLSAMAVLAVLGDKLAAIPAEMSSLYRERALTALRFSLESHLSGSYFCTDGMQWGHTWISALGIERMMHGVYLLEPYLNDDDKESLKRVLTSEADWLLEICSRNGFEGVLADPWDGSGKNEPESNIWNGALCWRTASMYPEHPHAGQWKERAHQFLINGVSIADDAKDACVVAGKPIKARHVGANFFPNYALDHHGYLNVGYMVICLSNAAMLHFDIKTQNFPIPESLYHHQDDLWAVVRKMVFSNGRLARIGGDSRLRYTYCQEYLLPVLAFAADHFKDPHAVYLINSVLDFIEQEASFNNNGSFYKQRLSYLVKDSPYYYTRLEADRACVLGMAAAYLQELPMDSHLEDRDGQESFERSAAGLWRDPEHGDVLHRSPTRLASFSWRAHGFTQGMCQSPADGHFAEWSQNLAGRIRFIGDDGVIDGYQAQHRELIRYDIDTFDGGFVTFGSVKEGINLSLPGGWFKNGWREGKESAVHQIVFAALPDAHTVVGFQRCVSLNLRTYLAEVKGLHLNLPNDVYQQFKRRLTTARGEMLLEAPAVSDEVIPLGSNWVNIDDTVGVVGLYGADELVVHRSHLRRGGIFKSLYVDEICYDCRLDTQTVEPNSMILDVGWSVISDINAPMTRQYSFSLPARMHPHIRACCVKGFNNQHYIILANFDSQGHTYRVAELVDKISEARDLVTQEKISDWNAPISIRAQQVRVLQGRG